MIATTANILNAYECYEYKRLFDRYYLSCDWSQLKTLYSLLTQSAALNCRQFYVLA